MAERNGISVVVVDDSEPVRDALRRLLDGRGGVQCVACTADGVDARNIIDRVRPDALLLDVEVPGVDTFALLRWMSANHPATRVLMLSGFVLPALIERSLDDGAAGYIHKDATPDAVVDCIRRAIEGEIVLSEAARDVVRGAAWQ